MNIYFWAVFTYTFFCRWKNRMDVMRDGYISTLDGWRAIAILGVIVCHATDYLFSANGTYPNSFFYTVTRQGALGVDLFFAISGFLICSRLLGEEARTNNISLKNFYIRRAFRILPPYVFYLVIIAVLAKIDVLSLSVAEWVSSLLFFRNYLPQPNHGGWYTAHFWSLAVEEHYYLIFPSLLIVLGLGRKAPMTRRLWGIVLLILVVTVWRTIEYRHGFFQSLIGGVGFFSRTDVRLDALLWGALCGVVLRIPKLESIMLRVAAIPGATLFLSLAFIANIILQPPFALTWRALILSLLLLSTILNPNTFWGSILETPIMRWVGLLSYSLYMWNSLFLLPNNMGRTTVQTLPLNLVGLLIVASLSYYFIEKPMISFGRSLQKQA